MSPSRTDVSVVVAARNERATLPQLLACVERQTLAPREVIVADGMSDDGTREFLRDAQRSRPWLVVVDNPRRQTSAALNMAVGLARSPVVARMDAHATYAEDYLARVCQVFDERPEVVGVGGRMTSVGRGTWGQAIATVLGRPIGLGGARHRVGGAGGPVDHAFSPAYRRQPLLDAGGFDETFLANEDFELDCRLRKAGGTMWLEPSAACSWQVRERPDQLARQMWRYGYFKARTLWVHPGSLRARQLAPPALLVSVGTLLVVRRRAGAVLAGAYLVAAGGVGARAAAADDSSRWRAAVVVPVVHVSWGAGLLAGMVRHARDHRTSVAARRGLRGRSVPGAVPPGRAHATPE